MKILKMIRIILIKLFSLHGKAHQKAENKLLQILEDIQD